MIFDAKKTLSILLMHEDYLIMLINITALYKIIFTVILSFVFYMEIVCEDIIFGQI